MNGGLFGDAPIGDSWIIHSRQIQPNVANRFYNVGISADKYLVGSEVYGPNSKQAVAWFEIDSAGTLNAVSPVIYTTTSGTYGYPINDMYTYYQAIVDSSGNWIVQFESEQAAPGYGKATNLVSLNSNLGENYNRVWVSNGNSYYCKPSGTTLSSSGKVALSTTFRSSNNTANYAYNILQYPAAQSASAGQTKTWDMQLYANNYLTAPYYNFAEGRGIFGSSANDVIFSVGQKGGDPSFAYERTTIVTKTNSSGGKDYAKYYRRMNPGGSTPSASAYPSGGCCDSSDNVYINGYSTDINGTSSTPIYLLKINSTGVGQYIREVRNNPTFSGSGFDTNDIGDIKADGSKYVSIGSGLIASGDAQRGAVVFIRNSSSVITAAYSIKCANAAGTLLRVDGETSKISGNDLVLTLTVHGPQGTACLMRLKDGLDGSFTGTSVVTLTDAAGNNPYDATFTIASFTAFVEINYPPGAPNYQLAEWDTGSGGIAVAGSSVGGRSYSGTGNITPGSSSTASQGYADSQTNVWQVKGIS
jgi:hypothetical protein